MGNIGLRNRVLESMSDLENGEIMDMDMDVDDAMVDRLAQLNERRLNESDLLPEEEDELFNESEFASILRQLIRRCVANGMGGRMMHICLTW